MLSELSVLIPVYNQDVTELVQTLYTQCTEAGILFEIRLYDDASTAETKILNQALNQLEHVFYVELQQNIGRSAIRNLLAREAKYNYLLFLDNDNAIPNPDYISRYQQAAEPETIVLGGTAYSPEKPTSAYVLRWVYGREREQKTAQERSLHPYHHFSINNTLLWRETFTRIGLDERLREYGFEDVAFGIEAEKAGVRIKHIDNPVIHLGIDRTDRFLEKTQEAVRNLHRLSSAPHLSEHSGLLRMYRRLQNLGLAGTYRSLFQLGEKQILRNLHSAEPNLFYFDLYRLKLLAEVAIREKRATA